jgi:hypothetical protein
MKRRTFVLLSTASALARPRLGLTQPASESTANSQPWYSTMRRCGQINFNERDPLTFNTEEWADYLAAMKVDAVLLNGGGIVAFYPTQIPYHHRSQFLGTRDLFGEMVAAVRRRSIRAVARMDCNWAYEDALRAHPEWFERNADGSPRPHPESPWLYSTCMFSNYFSEQMPAIYREINRRYAVDGFFTNGWPSTDAPRVCYCAECRKLYEHIGTPPEQPESLNPGYQRYYEAYMERVLTLWRAWDSVVREAGRDSVYVGNLGGGLDTVKDLKQLGDVAKWFNADHQGRSGDTPIWSCAQQGRVARAVMNGKTVTNAIGAYSTAAPTWRHVSKAPAELTLWMAQAAASGMVPWFHWLGGSPEDTRWKSTGLDFYRWLAANEPHFRNRRSIADIAVLYPQRTVAFYSRPESSRPRTRGGPTDYLQGVYQALLEARFTFDLLHESGLDASNLAKYRVLLLPNAAYLGDSQCNVIRKYVTRGGSLLATFETSRYDEWGEPRTDFALADVFAGHVAGDVVGPHGNSYMRIEREHPVLAGFRDTRLLPQAENRVPIRSDEALVLSTVPWYPAFPPEMVYPRQPRTHEAAAVFRSVGQSRIAYLPGDIDRTCWRSGNTDLSRLLQNAIRWLAGEAPLRVTVAGDGMVEVFAWETEPGYALHLLNYTNPNMTHGAIRKFYTVGPQLIRFAVERRIQGVRALRSGRAIAFQQENGAVTFTVPSLVDFETIAIT